MSTVLQHSPTSFGAGELAKIFVKKKFNLNRQSNLKYNPDLLARPLTSIILMTILSFFWSDRDLHNICNTKTRERLKSVTSRFNGGH